MPNMNLLQKLFQVMQSKGINIPQNVNTQDPNSIIQYLMNNGKISQDQYNRAYQQYRNMVSNNNSR
jgi:hypothetical protein